MALVRFVFNALNIAAIVIVVRPTFLDLGQSQHEVSLQHPPEVSDYKLIVNLANPNDGLTKKDARRYFLKKISRWQNGERVSPVDLPDRSELKTSFTREVLGKSLQSVRAYWQIKVFSGRGIPPPIFKTDVEVVAFVMEHPGAIGYVSKSTKTDGVKVLDLLD